MTTVVGGLYNEICHEPRVRRTYGSGVRAAAVLRDSVERLVTVADEGSVQLGHSVLRALPIEAAPRTAPVSFEYDTPLSRPHLHVRTPDLESRPDDVDAADVVVFGMVEQNPRVRCRRAVVDPQHSLTSPQIASLVTADELVVVANRREVHALVPGVDTGTAARSLREQLGAAAVIVKCGALGALVVTGSAVTGVPVLPTETVFPIGSGDVFSAALAGAWFEGAAIDEAAHAASQRTAGYCATRQTRPVTIGGQPGPVPTPKSVAAPPKVYVAASFATPEQRWAARTVERGLADIGAVAFSPLRDVGAVTDQAETASADLDGLRGCDSVLLLADSARSGPHFEAGWARHLNIPVVVASSDPDPTRFTMLRGTGAEIIDDWTSAAYRAVWAGLRRREGAG